MEADLQRFYQIDYRDRWRGRLSLRRINVLVQHLPPWSACGTLARGDKPYWSLQAHLLDDLRMTLVHTDKHPARPHPLRPVPQLRRRKDTPQRRQKIAAARQLQRERRERFAREAQED